nr:protein-L-isoaspartate(D-aspartate) O-methyltransferase [Rhizobium sp. Q54]
MIDFEDARERMVQQILRRGVDNPAVIAALRIVPREMFVAAGMGRHAYEDAPLAIGEGQTISQPYIVAVMCAEARIRPEDRVLEVGTGSGYAAAVLGRLAKRVVTVERHPRLAEEAEERLRELGQDNVEVHLGDGSEGFPEAAPFDAILVAAGSPAVPDALKEQLAIGGRLVIPIGPENEQRLVRVTRTGVDAFQDDDLGGVRFVPLIGRQGWLPAVQDDGPAGLSRRIAAAAEPLPDVDDPSFGQCFDRWGDRRIVLLGEASHGTSEFYRARAAITRRLIERHGFTVVAVEADWPDAAAYNRYVQNRSPSLSESAFRRFPAWMWRNREVWTFVRWLRDRNRSIPPSAAAGVYGLDIYNMQASISAVLAYLDAVDPEAAEIARQRYGCLTPWQDEPAGYGRAVLTAGYRTCEKAVVEQCRDLLRRQFEEDGGEGLLDAAQNARLVASAERYYRIMYYGGAESWNLRDTHMFETLEQVLQAAGADAKAVVWAHNSHIGDARATGMGRARGEINIGQLCRQRFGDDAALIGFGTHEGEVAAATDWDGDMEIKRIRPSLDGSYESLMHGTGLERFLLDLSRHPVLREELHTPRLERFIGVIYRPESERSSHYMEASLAQQFDAFVWFDRTTPVQPLSADDPHQGVPETYPSGL